jgi:predicted ArsR family transcriptional regulator
MSQLSVLFARGSATSAAAATSMEPAAPHLRDRALSCLQTFSDGLTADEIAGLLDVTVLAMRPRITELSKSGAIFKATNGDGTPMRRQNASGLTATMWRV